MAATAIRKASLEKEITTLRLLLTKVPALMSPHPSHVDFL